MYNGKIDQKFDAGHSSVQYTLANREFTLSPRGSVGYGLRRQAGGDKVVAGACVPIAGHHAAVNENFSNCNGAERPDGAYIVGADGDPLYADCVIGIGPAPT